MTIETQRSGDFRYRLYFRLMDICLFFAVVGLADFLLDRFFDFEFFGLPPALHGPTAIPVLFFNFLMPLFLIVAKFMRDEYAELLWNRTLVVLGYLAATIPFAIFVSAWLAYLALGQKEPGPIFDLLFIEFLVADFLDSSWMAFMLLFVFIFQFLRWRDSR